MADKKDLKQEMVDILLSVADKEETTSENIVVHFGFTATPAKRCLRQFMEFGFPCLLQERGKSLIFVD